MPDFFLNYSLQFYIAWAVIWLCISFINTSIYDFYKNEETAKLGKVFASHLAGNILIFFTFRWKIETDDPKKITILKKSLNYCSILFAIMTILCIYIWTYKFNHSALGIA